MSKLGCIKDKFDERDYLMRAYLPVVRLPAKVDYTLKMSPIRDQGDEGTCVAFAADAKKFRVITYARILNLYELRLALAAEGPSIIGVSVFEGMMKTKTGKVPMPKRGEEILGGHALCAIGYDDAAKLIKFKNSWSAAWGDKGCGYLPYAYIEKYMMDAWSTVDFDDPNPLTIAQVVGYKDGIRLC